MERVPERERVPESPEPSVAELLRWIGYERDAAWAAKLAILRMRRRADIELFGAFLREHDRHAEELAQLIRAADPRREIPDEPPFATRDALIVGALDDDDTVVSAMLDIEDARIARYEWRERRVRDRDQPPELVDALLERHRIDAHGRRAALQRRKGACSPRRERAA